MANLADLLLRAVEGIFYRQRPVEAHLLEARLSRHSVVHVARLSEEKIPTDTFLWQGM